MNVLEFTEKKEGCVGTVYKDHLGFDTIGIGTKLPITRDEAKLLLNHRMQAYRNQLVSNLHDLTAPQEVWDILLAMSYQLGVNGVLGFKKMILAIRRKDYNEAANQMLDSLWASEKQTPKRAGELADMMRKVK